MLEESELGRGFRTPVSAFRNPSVPDPTTNFYTIPQRPIRIPAGILPPPSSSSVSAQTTRTTGRTRRRWSARLPVHGLRATAAIPASAGG